MHSSNRSSLLAQMTESDSFGENNDYNDDYKHLYNGKEIQDELEWEVYDYGARFYDPVLARFHTLDPKTENYYSWTPFLYAGNNPIRYIDVNGEGPGTPSIVRFWEHQNKYRSNDKLAKDLASISGVGLTLFSGAALLGTSTAVAEGAKESLLLLGLSDDIGLLVSTKYPNLAGAIASGATAWFLSAGETSPEEPHGKYNALIKMFTSLVKNVIPEVAEEFSQTQNNRQEDQKNDKSKRNINTEEIRNNSEEKNKEDEKEKENDKDRQK